MKPFAILPGLSRIHKNRAKEKKHVLKPFETRFVAVSFKVLFRYIFRQFFCSQMFWEVTQFIWLSSFQPVQIQYYRFYLMGFDISFALHPVVLHEQVWRGNTVAAFICDSFILKKCFNLLLLPDAKRSFFLMGVSFVWQGIRIFRRIKSTKLLKQNERKQFPRMCFKFKLSNCTKLSTSQS